MDNLILIGEMAKLLNINVKTLRFYDDIDLIKSKFRYPSNGYRYYDVYQLPQIAQTLEYKMLDSSLRDIKDRFDLGESPLKVANFLEEKIELASERVKETEKGILLNQEKVKNIRRDMALSRNQNIYWRRIEKRYIIAKPYQEQQISTDKALLSFYEIYSRIQDLNLVTPHEAGYIVHLTSSKSKPLSYCEQYFNVLYDNTLKDIEHKVLPGGTFLCVNYVNKSFFSQIDKIKFELKNNHLVASQSVEVEMNTMVTDFKDVRRELQVLIEN